jgi:hypothetical protein
MVDVLDADRRWPVYYQVPRADVPRLVSQKAIVASSLAEGELYRFASSAAAAKWFAEARPVIPPAAAASSPLQQLDFGVPMGYPTAGVVFDAAQRPWFWSESPRPGDDFKRQIEDMAAGKRPCLTCGKILLIDREQRVWAVPRGGPGLFGFDVLQKQWIERNNLPVERPPKDPRDRDLAPQIIGQAYQSRCGLLFFGDRAGVHVFDGKVWAFQKLYQRNIDEDRFFDPFHRPRGSPRPANSYREIHRFSEPSFSEDSQGRVYVWTGWGWAGESGTIGFWVYDHGTWKNVDSVERLTAVIPRDPDELWLVSDEVMPPGTRIPTTEVLSVLKGGRFTTGEEAQRLLVPNLRFSRLWHQATADDGTAFLLLEDVAEQDSAARSEFRGVALRRHGPAVDLGNAAGAFFIHNWTSHPVVDPQGRVWGATGKGLTMMSPDGRQLTSFPITERFPFIRLAGANGQYAYFEAGGLWRFDPVAYQKSAHSEPFVPSARVRVRGYACGDVLGRAWCVWDVPDSPMVVFDGGTWQPRLEPALGNRPEKYVAAIRGVDGAMVFEDSQGGFHLFDAQGHAAADSLEKLVMQYRERLVKALPYPPVENVDRPEHLIRDAKGRIWWTESPGPRGSPTTRWGVVDSEQAIRGDMSGLGLNGAGQFTMLWPISDGSRVLVACDTRQQSVSGVFGVENGRITRLGDSPVPVVLPSSVYPQITALCDSLGRTWFKRDRDRPGPGKIVRVSQAVDTQGRPGVIHEGWLMLEDSKKGLWFKPSWVGPQKIVRLDAGGHEATLEVSGIADSACLAEAPDGTIWTLTGTELIRIRAEANRLTIVERYPVPMQGSDRLWCDREGRVWMVHATIPQTVPHLGRRQETSSIELIRLATQPRAN